MILDPFKMLYAIERKRDLSESFNQARARLSREVWDRFSIGCDSGPLSKVGVAWQPISQQWAQRLLECFASSEMVALRREDYVDGYLSNLSAPIINYLNTVNEYRAVTPDLLTTLGKFLADHESQISQWINHSWRASSIRPFNLRPTNVAGSRHLDGWPPAIRKMFILPGGASPETGTTWFRLRNGDELLFDHPRPCLLIFENSVVEHGLVSGHAPRPTSELDIVPARKTITEPFYPGLNGWYPWFPEKNKLHHLSAVLRKGLRSAT